MKIRKYHTEDFDQMMKLHREVLQHENVYRGEGFWEDDLLDIEKNYFQSGGDFLVGVEKEQIIAMGAIRKISEDTAEIVRMRVHPDHQGKGIGTSVLHELEKRAYELKYTEIILETDEKLQNARFMYEKNSYSFWKTEEINGYKCIWYKKNL
jgi:ribosomal protein S18 acetylase RimI-like enzyme